MAEGTLLEVSVSSTSVLYQIVEGSTSVELLENKNETGLIIGVAAQIGTWNSETLSFDKYGWVPEINSPVYLAKPIEPVEPPAEELLLGCVPDTNFPVLLNKKDAVSHHLAILGVTGSGKSVFARKLIRDLAEDGKKLICIDFTGEYVAKFADLQPKPIVDEKQSIIIFDSIDSIMAETAKFANQQDKKLIQVNEANITGAFHNALEKFIKSDSAVSIFELPDVSNTTGILDCTKWFFKILFEIAKNEGNYGKQLCIVLEEAHTVVPEWNFIGTEDKASRALVNSIGQIALQGRKYGVGFMVIAQRTANVSKTILTQCNSVVAFQQFDKTSADFLTNYMGQEMVEALPKLRPRQAIAVGKAFRSGMPVIFQVPDIIEPDVE